MKIHSAAADQFYGFPVVGSPLVRKGNTIDYSVSRDGAGLFDIISQSWGFFDADVGIDAHRQADTPPGQLDRTVLWTHADAVCFLQPHTAPYKYDSLD